LPLVGGGREDKCHKLGRALCHPDHLERSLRRLPLAAGREEDVGRAARAVDNGARALDVGEQAPRDRREEHVGPEYYRTVRFGL
jgi:hypothetical protein